MINYDDYPGEQSDCDFVEVSLGGCEFYADLLRRHDGGLDLALNRENSEFESLEIEKITWLRQEAGGQPHVLVERFPERELSKDLRRRVIEHLQKWVEANLGLPPGGKPRVRWSGE